MVRPATATDAQAVLDMLDRCTRESLFHRFHGYSQRPVYAGALLARLGDGSSLISWNGWQSIGLATVAPIGATTGDLGVLVEDAWQRKGVGTELVAAAVELARASGMTVLHADVLADDMFIVRALRRAGPMSSRLDSGTVSVDIQLAG
jgi:GNAT superfamily N-acetyltransferase